MLAMIPQTVMAQRGAAWEHLLRDECPVPGVLSPVLRSLNCQVILMHRLEAVINASLQLVLDAHGTGLQDPFLAETWNSLAKP